MVASTPAFFSHGMLTSQAAVSALSAESDRTTALGRLSVSYAAGMIAGSSVGGAMAKRLSLQASPLAACLITCAFACVTLFALPPLLAPRKETAAAPSSTSDLDLLAVARVAALPAVRSVLGALFTAGLSVSVYRSMISMAAHEAGFTPEDVGLFMSANAVVGLVANVFLIAPLTNALGGSEDRVLLVSATGSSASFLALACVGESLRALLLVPASLTATMFSSLLYTTSTGVLSKAVPKETAGTAISLAHALRSLTQIVSPVLGGVALQRGGVAGVCALSAAVGAAGVVGAAFRHAVFASRAHKVADDKKKL